MRVPVYREDVDLHPEHVIAARLAELQRHAPADIRIWTPLNSASGKWEALGKDWSITEDSPAVFAEKLCRRLGWAATAK